MIRSLAARGAALLIAACAALAHGAGPNEAYVWQRQWTPALRAALHDAAPSFDAWRVLAAESTAAGTLTTMQPDLRALAASQRAVKAVFRLNGSDPMQAPAALAATLRATVQAWRDAGLSVHEVEIDQDCATARLPAYAALLRALRATLPADTRLSITALPAWLDAPTLADVLALADDATLQVHAVDAPSQGLFDPTRALAWTRRFASRTTHPFFVALPAYASRVAFDAQGRATGVANEVPRALRGDDVREARVAPASVATLLAALDAAPPPHLAGIAWFRLPTEDDTRAWRLRTLQAVIARAPLAPALQARIETAPDGARDVVLQNTGNVDATAPRRIRVSARGCLAADALAGFRAQALADGWQFVPTSDSMLRAGDTRRIGWLRCEAVNEVTIDAQD